MKHRLPTSVKVSALVFVFAALIAITNLVRADGTEQLGPPSIEIAQGTDVAVAGTGLDEVQPAEIVLDVPLDVTVKQVLLYWSGASTSGTTGDDTLLVAGNSVTGTLIGGPTRFYRQSGKDVEFFAYRADITDLGLVASGENRISVEGMTFEIENHGAGIIAIYDDGKTKGDIQLRDGQDLAYKFFKSPLDKTVPQTVTFAPADVERTAQLWHFVASVVPAEDELRPNIVRITVGDTVTEYLNPFDSSDGKEWDSDSTPVIIPPGATSLTVEVLSDGEVGQERPASLSWIGVTAVIPEPDEPPNEGPVGCADFGQWAPGTRVEGWGAVHENLNIQTSNGRAIVLAQGQTPVAYWAPNPVPERIMNGGMIDGGFTDPSKNHDYEFEFVPGTFRDDSEAAGFSIQLVDYGDWNPNGATQHAVELVGYDAFGNVIDTDGFFYTTTAAAMPRSGEFNGMPINPYVDSDAVTAQPGEPGNYTLAVFGENLVLAKLRYVNNSANSNSPSDPLFAIATTCVVGKQPPQSVCADFNRLGPDINVEGLGTVRPELNISTSGGGTVVVTEGMPPKAYDAPNPMPDRVVNGNIGLLGGMHDKNRVHDYVFTFADGVAVSDFSLAVMDYGDYNPRFATEHEISLVGLNSSGAVVDSQTVSFTTAAGEMPRKGTFGGVPFNPYVQADASAARGELGNYRMAVSGSDITRVEMRYNNNVLPNAVSDTLFAVQEVCYLVQP